MSDLSNKPLHTLGNHDGHLIARIDRDQVINRPRVIQSLPISFAQATCRSPTLTQQATLAYMIDDKRYLNVTDRCTLACRFCPKHTDGPRVHDFDLTLEKRPAAQDIIAAIGDPAIYREIVYCGFGEPTLRLKLVLEVSEWIKAHHGRVRLNTDGRANLVHKRNVLPDLTGRIDALSVSMNAQNEEIYQRHCQPALAGYYQAMLDFLELAPRYVGEVTVTAIDGLEGGDIEAGRVLAEQRGVAFRRRLLNQVG